MGAPSGQIDCYPAARGPLGNAVNVVNGWRVTSYFGGRVDPITGGIGRHGGEDQAFAGCAGTPIIAPIGGLLSQGWDSSGGGNWSGIHGHNGDYWGFGHAQAFAFPGGGSRWVNAGQVIAWTGTTGGSTGPHNHIAFRPRGSNVYRDPHDILVAAANEPPPDGGGVAPPVVPPAVVEEFGMYVKNIDGHQVALVPSGGTYVPLVLTDSGRITLLEFGVVEKHPNGDEWGEVTDPTLNTLRPIIEAGGLASFGAR